MGRLGKEWDSIEPAGSKMITAWADDSDWTKQTIAWYMEGMPGRVRGRKICAGSAGYRKSLGLITWQDGVYIDLPGRTHDRRRR